MLKSNILFGCPFTFIRVIHRVFNTANGIFCRVDGICTVSLNEFLQAEYIITNVAIKGNLVFFGVWSIVAKLFVIIGPNERTVFDGGRTILCTESIAKIVITETEETVLAVRFNVIKKDKSIFIDNYFKERYEIHQNLNIPVFDVDAIECLIDDSKI